MCWMSGRMLLISANEWAWVLKLGLAEEDLATSEYGMVVKYMMVIRQSVCGVRDSCLGRMWLASENTGGM